MSNLYSYFAKVINYVNGGAMEGELERKVERTNKIGTFRGIATGEDTNWKTNDYSSVRNEGEWKKKCR